MKLFRVNEQEKTLTILEDMGPLRAFSEVSLLVQLLEATKKIGEGGKAIFLSVAEERQITALSRQTIGGLEFIFAPGPDREGVVHFVRLLLAGHNLRLIVVMQQLRKRGRYMVGIGIS